MRLGRLAAGLVSLAVVVAACGSSDDDASEPSGEVGPTAAAVTDGGASDGGTADAPAHGGTFRYGINIPLTSWDPHASTSANDMSFLALVYDRLVHMDPDGHLVPGLAESWEWSEDGTALTFSLRSGVTFHDGTPLDADAVKANLERAQAADGSVSSDSAPIESVEAPDSSTVVVHLTAPSAPMPAVMSGRLGMMVSPAAFENPDLDRMPVGAGMFTVESYVENDTIELTPAEGYWDPAAVKVDHFQIRILADPTTRMNAMRTGELDATILAASQVEEAEQLGIDIVSRSTLTVDRFYLNRSEPPFDDVLVRRAMNHAIDRQAIVDAVVYGQGVPTQQPFPDDSFAFSPNVGIDHYEYDPDKARALLTEAGYPDGFEYVQIVPAGANYEPQAEAVMAMFADVGIRAEALRVEPVQSVDAFLNQHSGQSSMGAGGARPDPAMTLELFFLPAGYFNPAHDASPDVIELYEQQNAEIDPEARTELLHQLVDQIVDEALDVPMYALIDNFAVADGVTGLEPTLLGYSAMEFRGVGLS